VPADELFQCKECMFQSKIVDLFEALGVISASAHPIKILRITGCWVFGSGCQSMAVAVVARNRSYPADKVSIYRALGCSTLSKNPNERRTRTGWVLG